jgi:hypothetical protein
MFMLVVSMILLLTFALFQVVSPARNPYVDIVGYLILPTILILGSLVVPLGILFKSWRVRRHDPTQRLVFRYPRFDLNDPIQRRAGKVFLISTFIFMPAVAVSSYHGYHYTDSAEFCAKACHSVMEPQATAYEYSAHARVACADCHIGAGASWFVKSKLSGTRQVFATLQDTYPRPIPPAITELRPARETCEQCHWPKKFFGAQLKQLVHFEPDENNTRREIDMLLKTGGGDETLGRAEGIHFHMALQGYIEYIATDDKLQVIPWVKWTDRMDNVWIYRADGRPSSDPPPAGVTRRMDCMDCHNRPAHRFRAPDEAVDLILAAGRIDRTLPFIKREAVKVLVEPYKDTETAKNQIKADLTGFYQANYPEIWRTRKASVNQAVDVVREVYGRDFFPDMRVDWRTYPDNIGHKNSAGCFRCHDGKHVNQTGQPISHECSICHTFLNPVEEGETGIVQRGEFVHPFDLEGKHAAIRCNQCHSGGLEPTAQCAGCHTQQADYIAGKSPEFARFDIQPDPMADLVTCDLCHNLTKPTTIDAIQPTCMDCHDDDTQRYETLLSQWDAEVKPAMETAEAARNAADRELIETLRRAGPLHNIEATRKILRELNSARPDPDVSTSMAQPDRATPLRSP